MCTQKEVYVFTFYEYFRPFADFVALLWLLPICNLYIFYDFNISSPGFRIFVSGCMVLVEKEPATDAFHFTKIRSKKITICNASACAFYYYFICLVFYLNSSIDGSLNWIAQFFFSCYTNFFFALKTGRVNVLIFLKFVAVFA